MVLKFCATNPIQKASKTLAIQFYQGQFTLCIMSYSYRILQNHNTKINRI